MATFKVVVFEHHKKEDSTWNVKVRITHNRSVKYMDTDYYVTSQQLNKRFEIKDPLLQTRTNDILKQYREEVIHLGDSINYMTAESLKAHLVNKFKNRQKDDIDFIAFIDSHINEILKEGRISSAGCFKAVRNSIVSLQGFEIVPASRINYSFLISWDKYLRKVRKIKGENGKITELKALSDSGVHHYMRDLRTLFNLARDKFNDEDTGIIKIPHYPFKKFKIGDAPATKKRNLSIEVLQDIFALEDLEKGSTMELAQDFAKISFGLIGMNAADIYKVDVINKGRIGYNRSKTEGKRKDSAFISVKVEPELLDVIDKYQDPAGKRVFNFYRRYSDNKNFVRAVNNGFKKIVDMINYDDKITTYSIRHTWATIARNKCRIPKEDIAMALNHVDKLHDVTDIYIEKDWTIIDEANRKVLDAIK